MTVWTYWPWESTDTLRSARRFEALRQPQREERRGAGHIVAAAGLQLVIIMPRPRGIKPWCWLTSVAYMGPNSRTERPGRLIGTEVAHVTRDLDTTFKVKRCCQHAGTGATWRINTKILWTCRERRHTCRHAHSLLIIGYSCSSCRPCKLDVLFHRSYWLPPIRHEKVHRVYHFCQSVDWAVSHDARQSTAHCCHCP